MDFRGKATRATLVDFQRTAQLLRVPLASLRAVIAVECNGDGFDSTGRPEILFERHLFYRYLQGAQRDRAVEEGLAYPRWGEHPYPRSAELRWDEFLRAAAINEVGAISSTSWGLGQILGSEFAEAKYSSPETMVQAFCDSERNQLFGMAHLIAHRDLDGDMREFPAASAAAHFAKRYNGAGYRKNHYDTKLVQAYHHFATQPTIGLGRVPDVNAERRQRIILLQKALKRGGPLYNPGRIDGIIGVRTVMAFQRAQRIRVDGIIGKVTGPLLEQALASMMK